MDHPTVTRRISRHLTCLLVKDILQSTPPLDNLEYDKKHLYFRYSCESNAVINRQRTFLVLNALNWSQMEHGWYVSRRLRLPAVPQVCPRSSTGYRKGGRCYKYYLWMLITIELYTKREIHDKQFELLSITLKWILFARAEGALTICLLIKSTTLMKPIRSRLRGDAKMLQMPYKMARGVRGMALE